jgi:hypothetical protein
MLLLLVLDWLLAKIGNMLGPRPRREKSALFSCVSVNFFGKTGRVSYFCTNLCITEIPVAS